MANERIPNDPFEPRRPLQSDGNLDSVSRQDSELQVDPELQEGPASGTRIALFAVAIALVLGAVIYGLNSSNVHEASTQPPAQTAERSPGTPQTGPGDTTARPNTAPGTTTGTAPAQPQTQAPANK